MSNDRTKKQRNGKEIGSVALYILGNNWEMVSGSPRMKSEVKGGAKILRVSSKTGFGIHMSGQERATSNVGQIGNGKVFDSTANVKGKSGARVLGDSSKKSKLGESSKKGVTSPTSSQEGTLVGHFDYRKQKINESETKITNCYSEKKRVMEKCPLKLAFCGICMDKKAKAEMFKSSCSHSFCLDCIGNHVAAKIRDNVIKVKCPDLACNVVLEPQNCKSFVLSKVIDRWEAALCESSLESKKIYCPFKDCSALLIDDGQQNVTSAECPHCHRLFCAQCQVPWHSGLECKSVKGKIMDKKFIDLATKEKWQKCPSCKFYVQRTQGCECITCRYR